VDGGKKRFNALQCPLCRTEYGEAELDAVNVSVIDGVHSGRLCFAAGGSGSGDDMMMLPSFSPIIAIMD
jgi:membrane-associated PAP2 superfamily phosphatase